MSHQSAGQRGGSGGGAGNVRGPAPPTQQFRSMNVRDQYAVDGSPLTMDASVAVPKAKPMPSMQVNPNVSKKVLDNVQASGMTHAEFPLRKAFTRPTTSVYTNHFAVKVDEDKPIYEYDITGVPRQMSKKTAKKLVEAMIKATPFLASNQNRFATDYARKLISWIKIPDQILQNVQKVRSCEGRAPIAISLQSVGTVDTSLLRKYAEGKVEPTKDVEVRVRLVNAALNMVVSSALGKGTFSPKANKFFIKGGHTSLGTSLCTIRGYYYAIRPGMGQILLNLSSCTSAFYKPILVSDFLNDRVTFPNQQERLAHLRGLRVQLSYDPVHTGDTPRSQAIMIDARMKRIAGTGLPVCDQTFQLKGQNGSPGAETTVKAYFEKTYHTKLNPKIPAINCGTESRPTWYPAETLSILPYQLFKRTVPDNLTADMLNVACNVPETTRALIEHEGLQELGLIPGQGLRPFRPCPAFQIDSRLLEIPATILPCPKPKYANGTVDMRKPNWNLSNRKFLTTSRNAKWKGFIIAVPQADSKNSVLRDDSLLNEVWTGFTKIIQSTYSAATCQRVGQMISPEFGQSLDAAKASMEQAQTKGADFVMLFLEKKSAPAYAYFKNLADCTYGMHSVCVTYDAKRGFNAQYWANIAMKINLKAGGLNHTVDGVNACMKDTLVLGADVTHPGQGSRIGTPSIAAVVGSVGQDPGKFFGSMRLQPRDTACEIIQDSRSMVYERLKDYYINNGKLPTNILYFRDGVGDSQYTQIKEQELPQIRAAFRDAAKALGLSTPPNMRLTAYVVGKRHHVKLFPKAADAMPNNGNCKPGTLVDTTITNPYFRDFYLQSHNSIKGTARSAHYFPLVNEIGLSEHQMQSFTHMLCYTYVRATMGVSYAPPAYYADRLCERGRCYLRDFFNPKPGTAWTNEPKKLKDERTKDAKAAREIKYKAQRIRQIYNGQITIEKSKAELEKEIADEADIEKIVMAATLEEAKKSFYGGEVAKNPWKSRISNGMFWM